MRNHPTGKAPNYTNAALVMGLVNLLWVFGVIWALFGLPVVLIIGAVLDAAITRLAR